MASENVTRCVQALIEKKLTIAFAESASAGRMSYEFSTVPDSGSVLMGGLVCYHICVKEDALQVPEYLIEAYTPESAEVTREMSVNLCQLVKADVCVALTGLTTPGGSETAEKPVGTIFVHVTFGPKQAARRFELKGNPEAIVLQAIDATADLILNEIT